MKKHTLFTLFFVVLILFFANRSLFPDGFEHDIIKPIPKSILQKSSQHKDYTYEFPVYDEKANIVNYEKVKGTFRKLSYQIFGKDNQRKDGIFSSVEIIRSYRVFAIERGGDILWERGEGGRLTFTIPKPNGDRTWCLVSARKGYYELDIVDIETEKEKNLSGAEEMKKE